MLLQQIGDNALIEFLEIIIHYLIGIVEACGALIILLGVGQTMQKYLRILFRRNCSLHPSLLRLELGKSLVLALEFQVAADILKTALWPEWNDILLLSATIVLRTVLNYVLEHEMSLLEKSPALSL